MNYRHYTSLIRPMDFKIQSNRFVVIISGITSLIRIIYSVTQELSLEETLIQSISAGITLFVLWAIVREIEPDNHKISIFVSLVSMPIFIFYTFINPIELVITLFAIRYINRTTGLKPTEYDYLLLVIAGIFYSLPTGNWHILFLIFSMLILELILEPDWDKYKRAATIGVIFPLFYFLSFALDNKVYIDTFRALNIFSVSLVIVFLLLTARKYLTKCDVGGNKLNQNRINAGQVIFALFVASSTFTAEKYLEFVTISIPIYFLFISLFGINIWRIFKKRIINRMIQN